MRKPSLGKPLLRILISAIYLLGLIVFAYEIGIASSIEFRFLWVNIFTAGLFGGIFVIGELFGRERDRRSRLRLRLFFPIALIVLLAVPWMQYASLRPSSPFSLVVMTSVVFFVVLGFMGPFILWPFKKWAAYGKFSVKERLFRVGFVLYDYMILFAIVSQAVGYALFALIQPSTAQMNPEVSLNITPAVTAIVLIYYRLQSQLRFSGLEIPRRIAEDAIIASFAVFAYGGALSSAGVRMTNPVGNLGATFPFGIGVGLVGLFLERYLLTIRRTITLSETAFPFSLKSFPDLFLEMFRSQRQSKLYEFSGGVREISRRQPIRVPSQLRFIQSKTARRIGMSLLIVTVLLGGLLLYWSPAQKQVTLRLPVWVVGVEIVNVPHSPVVLSDQIDFNSPRNYSIELVQVTVANMSFIAPLNSRFLRLNSTGFLVSDTQRFLTISVRMAQVRINLTEPVFAPIQPDQTQNPEFTYYPLFRDAEIFYALFASGYPRIVAFCEQTVSGTLTKNAKQVFAIAPDRERVQITITVEGESVPLDNTLVQSLDLKSINVIQNLLTQAKVETDLTAAVSQPPIPSWAENVTQATASN